MNFLDPSHPYLGKKCNKCLLAVIVGIQVVGTKARTHGERGGKKDKEYRAVVTEEVRRLEKLILGLGKQLEREKSREGVVPLGWN